MAIETKFILGDGDTGSMLQVTINGDDVSILDNGLGSMLVSYQPIKMEKITPTIEGIYAFNTLDWKHHLLTGELESATLIGFRID